MPFVSPSFLHITVRYIVIDRSSPLFRFDAVKNLVIESGGYSNVIAALSHRPGWPQLLPRLRYLHLTEDELDEKTIAAIPDFLRSHRNLVIILETENRDNLMRLLNPVCVIEGEFVPRKFHPLIPTEISQTERMVARPTSRTYPMTTSRIYPMMYIYLKADSHW